MKLGLGTAQFGLDYGITNAHGRVRDADILSILTIAARWGIRIIDTAPTYGVAERVLGRCFDQLPLFDLVTKTLPFDLQLSTAENLARIQASFLTSLSLLQTSRVYALLGHRPSDLLGPSGQWLANWLLAQRTEGRAQRVGVSVYSPDEARQLFSMYAFDIVQLPLNVLDQRMLASGTLSWLDGLGVEIHVRSAFLQGVLLSEPGTLDSQFTPLLPTLRKYRTWLQEQSIEPVRAALQFIGAACPDATILCGVTSVNELEQIVHGARDSRSDGITFDAFASNDCPLIDPRNWK